MALERSHFCPDCDGEREFYRSASTNLHLGEKVKWSCPGCDYQFVEINGIVSDQAEG
jgi:rubredoxin